MIPPIGPSKRAVADQPGEDVAGWVGHQFPRHHHDADDAGDQAADAKGNLARSEMREVVRRTNDIGGDVRGEGGEAEREHGDHEHDRIFEMREHVDRIPDGLAIDDRGRRGDRDADEGIERHRERQPERLTDDLVALTVRVAREIGNVERKRGPESDHAGERREQRTTRTGPLSADRERTPMAAKGSGRSRRRCDRPTRARPTRARSAAAP